MNLTPSQRVRALIAITAGVTVMAFALSSSIPLVSLLLEQRGVGNDVIGMMGALPALAFLFATPFILKLAHITGTGIILWGALAICSLSILGLAYTDNLAIWFILRLFIGLGMAALFLITETWLNQVAEEKSRGRTVALYVATMTIGFAAGPLLINYIGTADGTAFYVSSAIVAAGGICFLFSGHLYPVLSGKSQFSIIAFVRVAPLICAAALLVAFFDGSVLTLLPVYGVKVGMTGETAVLMSSVLLAGNVLLQLPIGWLADKIGREKVISGCGVVGLAGAVALPFVITEPLLLWPMLVFWGGAVVGTYTIALVIMGQKFQGAELVTANAAANMLWGVGSLLGPASAGYAMELYEPHGMPVIFIIISVCFVGISVWQSRKPIQNMKA